MLSGKVMIIHWIVGLINKMVLYKMSYFPAPYTSSKGKIKVKLGLSNYATKFNSKSGTAANTSKFAKKFDLARN